MIRHSLLLAFSVLAVSFHAQAQAVKILNQPTSGTHTASQSIILAPGFSTSGSFHAYISNAIACDPVSLSLSTNQNFVAEHTFKQAGLSLLSSGMTNCQINTVVNYFDGLGRSLQSIRVQGSPEGRDAVQPFAYDVMGRQSTSYMPYTDASNGGAYRADAFTKQPLFYNGSVTGVSAVDVPSAQTVAEYSPLARTVEQGYPGSSWQPGAGHTVRSEYGVNNTTDRAVRWYKATPGSLVYDRVLSTDGLYPAGELSLTIIKDENWSSGLAGTSEEYKDRQGRVVLKRIWQSSSVALSTYYVYDDGGHLSFVLPPGTNADAGLPNSTALERFAYQYRYDGRNRLIEKWIPGKDNWEEMVYNKLDQVVFSRDAGQVTKGERTFFKYDGLGRQIFIGYETGSTSRADLQTIADGWGAQWEQADAAGHEGYTNNVLPQNVFAMKSWVVNYYDDYSFPGASFVVSSGIDVRSARGLLTGTKTYRTDGTEPLLTAFYYDDKGQLIQTVSRNHLGGIDSVSNRYNFAGELTNVSRKHHAKSIDTHIANRYTYDAWGRKRSTFQDINAAGEVELTSNSYNEADQLWVKSMHNNLQSTEYAYHSRGWLKSSTSPQFSMTLSYQDGTYPKWNGNITNQTYTNGGSNTFIYQYDALNRLTVSAAGNNLGETVSYDNMGNITSLSRDGYGTNNYTSYQGNRLMEISGFSNGTYVYDTNGNQKTDGPRGINVVYNQLNLPQQVTGALGRAYLYDATGKKLRMINTSTGDSTSYVNGIHYLNGNIEFIQTEAGIARKNGGSYRYEYNLTDHLGNVRATFYQNPVNGNIEVIQRDNYYAFGKRVQAAMGTNNYLYNGKELQEQLEQYDYGARFYDPVIGRWSVVDPLAEMSRIYSPYVYGNNNPIVMIDPDGMLARYNWETGVYENNEGEEVSWQDVQYEYGIGTPESDPVRGAVAINTPGKGLKKVSSLEGQDLKPYETPNSHICGGYCKLDHKSGEQFSEYVMTAATLLLPIRFLKLPFNVSIPSRFATLAIASRFGIAEYGVLVKATRAAGYQVHHLVEKRFAALFGIAEDKMLGVVLTKAEHQIFTNAWRREIGYTTDKAIINTATVTKVQVENAARVIYKEYPEILKALGL